MGDPMGIAGLFSAGPGLSGIGKGGPGGVGPGHGSRQGGGDSPGGSGTRITRGPQVIHSEEPEYSEEARKARFQGTVVLAIEVDVNGRPENIRVLRGLGLGLDEKAIEALERWRFRPAIAGDHPVPAQAVVEVTFRLL